MPRGGVHSGPYINKYKEILCSQHATGLRLYSGGLWECGSSVQEDK